jgi:hypothetical protein
MTYEELTSKFKKVIVTIAIYRTSKGEFRFAHKDYRKVQKAMKDFESTFDGYIYENAADIKSLEVYDTFICDDDQEAMTLAGLRGYLKESA